MKNIYLLSGPISSGKSTKLLQWTKKQNSVLGIICLKKKGIRQLYSLNSKKSFEFELREINKPVLKIGKYVFSKESFLWAEKELEKAISSKPHWLILDEIGKLELKGLGFDKITKRLISATELINTNLIFVVRDYLVNDMIKHYNLKKEKIKFADFI